MEAIGGGQGRAGKARREILGLSFSLSAGAYQDPATRASLQTVLARKWTTASFPRAACRRRRRRRRRRRAIGLGPAARTFAGRESCQAAAWRQAVRRLEGASTCRLHGAAGRWEMRRERRRRPWRGLQALGLELAVTRTMGARRPFPCSPTREVVRQGLQRERRPAPRIRWSWRVPRIHQDPAYLATGALPRRKVGRFPSGWHSRLLIQLH